MGLYLIEPLYVVKHAYKGWKGGGGMDIKSSIKTSKPAVIFSAKLENFSAMRGTPIQKVVFLGASLKSPKI